MNKPLQPFLKVGLLPLLLALLDLQAAAQFKPLSQSSRLNCRIDQVSIQDRKLNIACAVSNLAFDRVALRFIDQFAGVDHLSERIYQFKVKDEQGATLPLEIHGDGLFIFSSPGKSKSIEISYETRLARALDPSQYALTSSLGPESAFLMPGDLLPRLCAAPTGNCLPNPARLQISAPQNWNIATIEKLSEGFYEIDDPSKAIFFLGRLRERTVSVKAMSLRLAVSGAWSFSDDEAFKLAEAIAREQAAMIDGAERGDFLVTLAPFPQPLTGLRSSGVAIGRTVVLQLNPNNDAAQTLAHYRRHLAHEMFHFYLPNAFQIRENFDWFWEGFTRYVALLTLARLGQIDQREYLDAIGLEYEASYFNPLRLQVSLTAASPEKFESAAGYDLVYRKGMLVAALYDLELRRQSRGKLSLRDVIRSLYRKYADKNTSIGNLEVLSELGKFGGFKQLIRDDIEGAREINLAERIKPYGLVFEWGPATRGRARISPAAKLSRRQRELLNQLGSEKRNNETNEK